MGDGDYVDEHNVSISVPADGVSDLFDAIVIENNESPNEILLYSCGEDSETEWIIANGAESFVALADIR